MTIDVAIYADLDAVAADANGALDRAHQPSLFRRLEWFRLLLDHCPPDGKPFVARARDPSGNTAWLFLMRHGKRATALANWYSFETCIIFSDGNCSSALAAAIGRRIRQEGIAIVELFLVPENITKPLINAFRKSGWLGIFRPASINWTCATKNINWQNYWNARPGKLRNTVARKMRLGRISTSIIREFSDDSWRLYEEVYADSWKPAEGSPDFLRALAREESKAGTLRLGLAFDGTKAVAAQFWLVENGVATIHKLAHREDSRAYSPGSILTCAMFRNAIEVDNVERIDFGIGNDRYKSDWMDGKQPLYRLEFFDIRTVVGFIAVARAMLSKLVRTRHRD